jgi:hypothetical protein
VERAIEKLRTMDDRTFDAMLKALGEASRPQPGDDAHKDSVLFD